MKLGTLVRPKELHNLDEAFAPLKEIGFSGCQLAYKPEIFRRDEAERIREAADRNGIEISAHFLGYPDPYTVYDLRYGYLTNGLVAPTHRAERLAYLMRGCSFVKWLGITDLILHAGFIPNNPFDPDYHALVACIRRLGAHAGEMGLNLLFETGAESPVSLLRLIREAGGGNLYVNLDTGNSLMYGYANPADALHTLGEYVRGVHVKDGVAPTDCDTLGAETRLGEGMVDFPRFFRKLRALRYGGFLTIEREITGPEQLTDILHAKQYIEDCLARIQSEARGKKKEGDPI